MLKLPKYYSINIDEDQIYEKRTTLRTRSFSSKLVVYPKGFSHISRKKIKLEEGVEVPFQQQRKFSNSNEK